MSDVHHLSENRRPFHPALRLSATTEKQISCLQARIEAAVDRVPLESGVTHEAEPLVAEALVGPNRQLEAFAMVLKEECVPDLAASMLRLAGRVGRAAPETWRREVVRHGLASAAVAMREAAVEAVEQWADPALLPLLRDHTEPVRWLKDYLDDVIEDLSE